MTELPTLSIASRARGILGVTGHGSHPCVSQAGVLSSQRACAFPYIANLRKD